MNTSGRCSIYPPGGSLSKVGVLCYPNDGYLQHTRVDACAAIGAKYLSRQDSRVLGILGSGGMARTYAMAICAVRPIEKIRVFSSQREIGRAMLEMRELVGRDPSQGQNQVSDNLVQQS